RFGESNGWLDGQAAVMLHPVGMRGGQVLTVGAVLDEALQNRLIDWLLGKAQITPMTSNIPEGVEVARRVAEGGESGLFLIIHTRQVATVPLSAAGLPANARDLLS